MMIQWGCRMDDLHIINYFAKHYKIRLIDENLLKTNFNNTFDTLMKGSKDLAKDPSYTTDEKFIR